MNFHAYSIFPPLQPLFLVSHIVRSSGARTTVELQELVVVLKLWIAVLSPRVPAAENAQQSPQLSWLRTGAMQLG